MEDSNNNSNNNYLDSLDYESFLNNTVLKETTNSFYFVSTKENYENNLDLGGATVSGFDSYEDVIGESVKNNGDTGVVKFSVCDDTSIYFATESELSEEEIEECINKNYDIILLPSEKGNKYIILNPDIIEKSSFLTNEEAQEDYEALQEGYNSALVEMFTQFLGENTAENNDNRKNNQRQNSVKNTEVAQTTEDGVSDQVTEEDEEAKKELDNYLEQLAAFNIIDKDSEITYDKLLEYQDEYTSLFSSEDGLNVDVSYLKHAISSIKEINPGLLSLNKSVNNFNVNSNIGLSSEYMTQIQSCKDFVNELMKSDADGLSGSVVSYQSRLDRLYDSLHADTSEWQIYEDTLNMQNLEAFAEIEELTDIEKANLAETYAQELSEHATKYRENMSHRTEEILDQSLPSDQNVNIDELLDYANNFRTYYVTTTLDSIARKKYHLDPSNSVLDISEEEQKYYSSHFSEFEEYDQQYRIREYLIVDSKVKNNERLTQWELNYRSENADYFISYAKELDSNLNDRFFKYTNKEYNSYAELESDPTVPVKTCEVELTPEERELERERLIKEKQEKLHTTEAVEIDDSEIPKTKTVAIYNPYSLATDFERCVMMTYITDAYETSNSNYEKMRISSDKRLDEIQRELSSNYTAPFHEALVSEKYDPYCAGITMGQVCELIEEKRKGLEYQKEQKEPNEKLIKTIEDQIAYEERVLELFREKMDLYDANGSYASMYEYQAQADSYLLKLNECRQAMIMEKPASERTDEEKDFVNVDYPQVRLKVRNDYLQWKQALAFSEKYKDSAIDNHMNYYGFETIKKGYDVKGIDDKYVPSQDVSFGGINERYYKQGYEFDETSEIEISELIDKNEVKSAHLFTKKTDFDKNSKTRICKIEQNDTKEGKYLTFYDSNGNEIKDITSSELAIYCALNNESIPKRRYCNIKDNSTGEIKSIYHDLKDEVKSLGYLDSKETSTKVLSYLCNKALITADASDVNRFNVNFNYFTNLGKKTEGKRIANKWLAKAWIPGEVTSRAFLNGVFQFCNGFVNLFGGADGKVSSYDYALMYYSDGLKDKYGGGVVGEVVSGYNDIVTSIGNMAIPMAVSIIGSYACPAYAGVFQTISSALMGMSAAGNSVEQGLQMGMTMGQAYTYGILTGLSEAVLERFLGGIPGLSNLERFSELSGIKGLAAKMLSEAIEEGLQEALDPVFMYAVGAGDLVDMSFGEYMSGIAKSAFYGAITAGVLNGLGSVANKGLSKLVTGTSTGLTIIMSEFAQRGGIFQNMDTFKSFLSEVSNLRAGGDFELSNLKKSISTNPEFSEKYSQYKNNYESKLNDIKNTLKADPDNALAQLQLEQMEKTKLMSFDEFTEYAMMETLLSKSDVKNMDKIAADLNAKLNQITQLTEDISQEQDVNKKAQMQKELASLNSDVLSLQSKLTNMIFIASFNGDVTKISNYFAAQMLANTSFDYLGINGATNNEQQGLTELNPGQNIEPLAMPEITTNTDINVEEVNAKINDAQSGVDLASIIEHMDIDNFGKIESSIKAKLNGMDSQQIKAFLKGISSNNSVCLELLSDFNSEYMVKVTEIALEPTLEYYAEAAAFAGTDAASNFETYRTHCELHVKDVAMSTIESVNKLMKTLNNSSYSNDVNVYDLFVAAIWHDVGMAAGANGIIGIDSHLDKGSGLFNPTELIETKGGNITRSNHTLNSALSILLNSDIVSEMGANPAKVALLVFAHSKSNSGMTNLTKGGSYNLGISILQDSINEYNKIIDTINENSSEKVSKIEYGGNGYVDALVELGLIERYSTSQNANGQTIYDIVYNSDELIKIATQALALRIGDANTTNDYYNNPNAHHNINQAGQEISYDVEPGKENTQNFDFKEEYDKYLKDPTIDEKTKLEKAQKGDTVSYEDFLKYMVMKSIDGVSIKLDGNVLANPNVFTYAYVLGEGNLRFRLSDIAEGYQIHEVCEVKNGNFQAAATLFNINERIGELKSGIPGNMSNFGLVSILLNTDTSLSSFFEYLAGAAELTTTSIGVRVEINGISDLDMQSFTEFAKGLDGNISLDEAIMKFNQSKSSFGGLSSLSTTEIIQSIQTEIDALDKTSVNYAQQVQLLQEKQTLLLDLRGQLQNVLTFDSEPSALDALSESSKLAVKEAAKVINEAAIKLEPEVTAAMKLLEDSDCSLVGLEHNLKSLSSIEEKLARNISNGSQLVSSLSGDSINDSLRYTLLVPTETYTETVFAKLKLLTDAGYQIIDINNAWGGQIYQGLNLTLYKDGTKIELQFHTEESFNTKEVLNHQFYEISRNPAYSKEIRDLSKKIQAINQSVYVGDSVQFNYYTIDSIYEGIVKHFMDSCFKVGMDRSIAAQLMTAKYGDAGYDIHNKLVAGKMTTTEILDSLNGPEKAAFEDFLANTEEGRYLNSLTKEELAAVVRYTGGDYSEINWWLRSGNIPADEVVFMETLERAISKYGGLSEPTQLYRGIDAASFTGQPEYQHIFDGIDTSDIYQVYKVLSTLTGHEFGDKGYMSTSPSYKHSFATWSSCPIVLEIYGDTGTPGAYINQISQFYNSENEFLLAAGTTLEMVEILPPTQIDGQEKIIVRCVVKKN